MNKNTFFALLRALFDNQCTNETQCPTSLRIPLPPQSQRRQPILTRASSSTSERAIVVVLLPIFPFPAAAQCEVSGGRKRRRCSKQNKKLLRVGRSFCHGFSPFGATRRRESLGEGEGAVLMNTSSRFSLPFSPPSQSHSSPSPLRPPQLVSSPNSPNQLKGAAQLCM